MVMDWGVMFGGVNLESKIKSKPSIIRRFEDSEPVSAYEQKTREILSDEKLTEIEKILRLKAHGLSVGSIAERLDKKESNVVDMICNHKRIEEDKIRAKKYHDSEERKKADLYEREIREKMRLSHLKLHPKSRFTVKLSMDGDYIAEYPSVTKAAQSIDADVSCVRRCCLRGDAKLSVFGYRFIYYREWVTIKDKIHEMILSHTEEVRGYACKKVVMLTIFGEYKKEFKSIKEASDHVGVSSTAISRVCKNIDPTVGGYRFMFLQEYEARKHEDLAVKSNGRHGVYKYSKSGRIVEKYKSMRVATEETGLSAAHIRKSCRDGGSEIKDHRYYYRYVSDVHAHNK